MQSSISQSQQPQKLEEPDKNRDNPLVAWWVRITSPSQNARRKSNNAWREEVTSLLFLVVFVNVSLPIPGVIHNPVQLTILLVVFAIDVGALILKRVGYMTLAGVIVMITTEVGIAASILSQGASFDSINLALYDNLVQASLTCLAFFPPAIVFVIVLFNCCFLVGSVLFLHHAPDLTHHLAQSPVSVLASPFLLQIMAATLAYIIVTALIKAIRRADKAEKLAELESQLVDQQRHDLEMKRQLDVGIREILSTLNDAANGNFSVRAPVRQDNALWRVGYSINNLLARLQGFKSEKAELEKTRQITAQLITVLKTGKSINLEGWTGTCLDPVIVELMHTKQTKQPSSGKNSSGYRPGHPAVPTRSTNMDIDIRN
jgi:hypothetical protein